MPDLPLGHFHLEGEHVDPSKYAQRLHRHGRETVPNNLDEAWDAIADAMAHTVHDLTRLQRAREALQDGDPDQALAYLDQVGGDLQAAARAKNTAKAALQPNDDAEA